MHDHAHNHPHDARGATQRRLAYALGLVLLYLAAEVVGGILTGSLALLADAGHMLSDAGALGLSLFATWVARRPPTPQRTYGYYRIEILAALVNGAALLAVSVFIFVEGVKRLSDPPEVLGGAMLAVAVGGLAVNLAGLAILGGDRDASLNVRGAWLHVLTDALGSVGAIVASLLIWLAGWNWADPVASLLIGLLVVYSAWRLVWESVAVLMESAPRGIDVDAVRDTLAGLTGVVEVHDLHVWTITSGLDALSAHVVVRADTPTAALLNHCQKTLHERFGIDHLTIQIEPEGFSDQGPVCP